MDGTKVYCAACKRLCGTRQVAGELRPSWHKSHAGRGCAGAKLPGLPSGIPAAPNTVRVGHGAYLDALDLLEELRDMGSRTEPCPFCKTAPGCSHGEGCLTERATAIAAALEAEVRGERAA